MGIFNKRAAEAEAANKSSAGNDKKPNFETGMQYDAVIVGEVVVEDDMFANEDGSPKERCFHLIEVFDDEGKFCVMQGPRFTMNFGEKSNIAKHYNILLGAKTETELQDKFSKTEWIGKNLKVTLLEKESKGGKSYFVISGFGKTRSVMEIEKCKFPAWYVEDAVETQYADGIGPFEPSDKDAKEATTEAKKDEGKVDVPKTPKKPQKAPKKEDIKVQEEEDDDTLPF